MMSPYAFGMDNPIVMNDPDGKEAEVKITRNPNGGGTITLSSTIFITGENAAGISAESQTAFNNWKTNGGGKGTYTDPQGNKWDLQINMTFKVATPEDVKRITNATNESAGENLTTVQKGAGRAEAAGTHGGNYKPSTSIEVPNDYGGTRKQRTGSSSGNQSEIYSGDTRGGHVIIHENLHLMGLGDRYSDVSYLTTTLTKTTGAVTTGSTAGASIPHVGFEKDIMATDNSGFSQIHVDNLAKAALSTSEEKHSDDFIMGRQVDDTKNRDATAVPQTKTESGQTWERTYSQPTYTEPGTPRQ